MTSPSDQFQKLNRAAQREFLGLVDQVNSSVNGTRVVGRLRMGAFLGKYGKDQCDTFYNAYKAKLEERNKK